MTTETVDKDFTEEENAEASSDEQNNSENPSEVSENQGEVAEGEVLDEEESAEEEEQSETEKLQASLKESEDRYTRLLAEFENFKRRNRQELELKLKYAQQPLALSILPELDNLERALDHAQDEGGEEQAKELIKGIELIQQELLTALEKHKVLRVGEKGEPFDPKKHEAVGVVDSEDVQPDHVANVFRAGYVMHDRVIRPAMVQVAKK